MRSTGSRSYVKTSALGGTHQLPPRRTSFRPTPLPNPRNHFNAGRLPSAAAFVHVAAMFDLSIVTSAEMTTVSSRDTKPFAGSFMAATDTRFGLPQAEPLSLTLNVIFWCDV